MTRPLDAYAHPVWVIPPEFEEIDTGMVRATDQSIGELTPEARGRVNERGDELRRARARAMAAAMTYFVT